MPTVSEVQSRPTTPTQPSDAGPVARDLVHAGNLAGDASVSREAAGTTKSGQKQGYIFMPVVGCSDDEAGPVLGVAATRLKNGKDPWPVIFANAADMAAFKAAVADQRASYASGKLPKASKQYLAATEPDRIPTIDDSVAGLIRTLDREGTKLYVVGHGEPGLPGLIHVNADNEVDCFSAHEVAQLLKEADLDQRYRDIRLLACDGATLPKDGGLTTAAHFVDALGAAGFEAVEVSAYPGIISTAGKRLDDGEHHKTVLVGEDQVRVRASSVRLTTTYRAVQAVKQGVEPEYAFTDELLPPAAQDGDNLRDLCTDVPDAAYASVDPSRKRAEQPPVRPAIDNVDVAGMHRVGDKPGGIAQGGIHQDQAGVRWLVKSYPDDRAAVNEYIAMQLFAEVGLRVPVTRLVALDGAYGGGTGIASQWIDGLEPYDASNAEHRKQLQQNFALYAWLGAWDVIGRLEDNIAFKDGDLVHLDGGCSLYCRATGGLKSTGFPEHVVEIDAMRGLDPSVAVADNARALFGAMTQAELERAAHRFGAQAGHLSPDRLRKLTAPYESLSDELSDRLIARREQLLGRDFNTGEDRIECVLGIPPEQGAMALRKKRLSTRPEDLAISDLEYVAIDHNTLGGDSEINQLRGETFPRTSSAPLLSPPADSAVPTPATEAGTSPSPPASTPLEKRYAALAGLRDIAEHLAASGGASTVHATKLLEKPLVAHMTGILCRLPEASKRTAADRRAFQGVIDYLDLLAGCLEAGHLPAAETFERLSQPLKFNGRDTNFLLATASMAGSHARTAHALGDLLGAMRRAPDGIDAARLRHDLLRLRGEGGLWRGDKYDEFYGRAFHDGRVSEAADSRFVLAYRLAQANLIPTKSESREVVSSRRADKYLRAARRAAAIASTPTGWQALSHATPAMGDLCRGILERHAPPRLASSQAGETRRLDRQQREERRSQALSHVEGVVAQTVQEAWDEAMHDARRHMRPSLLSWFFNAGAASIWNDAADGLPALAPPELVRGTLEKVLQTPRMIEWVAQLEAPPTSSAAADAVPDLRDVLRAQVDGQRERTVQAAREQALQQVGKEAQRAARAAEALATRQAMREAGDRARQEARRVVEDQQRRVLRDLPAPGPDVREDLGGLREHLRRQAEAREQQAARVAAEQAVRERARDLALRAEEETQRLLGQARHAATEHLSSPPWRDEANRSKDAGLMALADRVLARFHWQVRNFEQWDALRPARWE